MAVFSQPELAVESSSLIRITGQTTERFRLSAQSNSKAAPLPQLLHPGIYASIGWRFILGAVVNGLLFHSEGQCRGCSISFKHRIVKDSGNCFAGAAHVDATSIHVIPQTPRPIGGQPPHG